jgi:hypothetical protein
VGRNRQNAIHGRRIAHSHLRRWEMGELRVWIADCELIKPLVIPSVNAGRNQQARQS